MKEIDCMICGKIILKSESNDVVVYETEVACSEYVERLRETD